MIDSSEYNIYWRQINPVTFKYGSRIQFLHDETIFSNHLMPSGIVIHEWKMKTNYVTDRFIPTLPFLKKGETYIFNFHYNVMPENSIYFKIIFYLKNGTILSHMVINNKKAEVTFPEDAHSYKVQMMNAASEVIHFRKISVKHKNNQSKIDYPPELEKIELINAIMKQAGHLNSRGDVNEKFH